MPNNGYTYITNTSNTTSGGNSVITYPTTTISSTPYVIYPTTNVAGGFNLNSFPTAQKYLIFNLPRKEMPEAVYVAGRMVSLGILGSDVECAFAGDTLVFTPGLLPSLMFNNKITLIVEYAEARYHYNINHTFGVVSVKENTNIIEVILLSIIKKGEKCSNRETL